MPDLTANDAAQIAEAARQAGVLPARAHLFTRTTGISAVPRDPGGMLDAAALAAAVGTAVAAAPELTVTGWAPAQGTPRHAPVFGAATASPVTPTGASVYPGSSDAEVAELLAQMRAAVGLAPDGDLR